MILLLERELCVCDIFEALRLPQSTVSRHLNKLKSAGLVLDRRDGKWVHYRLSGTAVMNDLRVFLREHLVQTDPFSQDRERLNSLVASGRCAADK